MIYFNKLLLEIMKFGFSGHEEKALATFATLTIEICGFTIKRVETTVGNCIKETHIEITPF